MRFPTLFVNHGGGPMPLMGRQPELVQHMKETVTKWLPKKRPKAIVVLTAHWESNPIQISSHPAPDLYFDYYGFPPETYKYKYPVPGNPELALQIRDLLKQESIPSQLNRKRGLDHGVFIPLKLMYPEADIPVVAISLHPSLSIETHWKLGQALEPLRDQDVLIVGSGYSFHNLPSFFNPTAQTRKAAAEFNDWVQTTMLHSSTSEERMERILHWESAPSARACHPREEHLLPLFMAAAAAGSNAKATLIYNVEDPQRDHAVSSYMFS